MVLTNVNVEIVVALVSAIFGSLITLIFQWLISNIGKTRFYAKVIDIKEDRLFSLKLKATHTKKKKFLITDITMRIYGSDSCLDFIQCDKSVINHHGIQQQLTPEVKTYRYNFVLSDEFVLEEELHFFSKHQIDMKNFKFYLIINNKDYYPIEIKINNHPRYKLLKKISRKERVKLDGPYK